MTYIFLFLSSLGLLDALFLTQQHYNKSPFECPLFGGCDVVTTSVYSEIFNVPVALLGLIYYLTIFSITLYSYLKNNKRSFTIAAQFTLAGFLTSLYLLYLQIYILQTLCFYCTLSALISTLLFISGYFYLRKIKNYETKIFYKYVTSFNKSEIFLGLSRISLGFIFLWSFIDKFPALLMGSSPAYGFLQHGTQGILADTFQNLAGNPFVDFMYMFGMFAIGIALIFGITKKLATIGGILMMLFIYLAASLPPENNPLIDEHIIYIFLLMILYYSKSYEVYGLHKYWRNLKMVKKHPFLI